MNKADRVRAAKERATQAATALVAFDKAVAQRAAEATSFAARWDAFRKRSRQVIANLAGEYVTKALADFHAEFGYGATRPTGPKAIAKAIEGGAKIGGNGYGSSYSLNGLAPRLRLLTKPQVQAVGRAEARMNRAKHALTKATQDWQEAKKAAFDAGEKVSREALVAALVKREGVRLNPVDLPDGITDTSSWRRDGLVEKASQANTHLLAVRKGDECSCHACALERSNAVRRQAEVDRIAAFPRIKVKCPDHGMKVMRWAAAERNLGEAQAEALGFGAKWGVHTVAVAYCPVATDPDTVYPYHALLLTEQTKKLARTKAKADAAAVKAAKAFQRGLAARKAAAAKLPPPDEGDEIAFVCPGCDHVNDLAEVMSYGDDGDEDAVLVVGCSRCGAESSVGGVARLTVTKEVEQAA